MGIGGFRKREGITTASGNFTFTFYFFFTFHFGHFGHFLQIYAEYLGEDLLNFLLGGV